MVNNKIYIYATCGVLNFFFLNSSSEKNKKEDTI